MQTAYETFVTDTNAAITAAEKDILHKSKAKAQAEADQAERKEEREGAMGELEELAQENADLHKSCDYTLKNFDLRQEARANEMEALKQCLSMLSGAKFSAFLQNLK